MIPTRSNWVSPFERLYALQREIDRTFNETNGAVDSGTFLPPMDVVETNDEILCHLEVPGMSRDDLDIRVEGNVLIVAGEKKFQQQQYEKEGGFRSVERRYGRFERSFALPRTVDAGTVKASYDNGILTIVLPKAEESKPRRIQIEDGSGARQLTN
jgi:HSP20 family protein